MTKVNSRILVIVVLYNGAKWLDQCCESIKASTVPLDAFFVDNCSTDDSVDIVKRHLPDAFLYVSNMNLGFGKANNIGMRYALENGYDYVFLLNQDAYIAPDMMEKLLAVLYDMEKPGIISPIHLNGGGTKVDAQFRDCLYYTVCPGLLEDSVLQQLKSCYLTYMGYAAAWLLPIATIRTIGGFDPIFYHYGEDVHYVSRVLYHGLNIYNVPGAFVRHDRNFVGNEQAYKRDILYRSFKNSYLDLNRKGNWWFSRSQLHNISELIRAFFTLHWMQAGRIIYAYSSIFLQQGMLRKNILANRQTGTNWL